MEDKNNYTISDDGQIFFHRYKQCVYLKNSIAVVTIPKNSSSSLRTLGHNKIWLCEKNYCYDIEYKNRKLPVTTYAVFLRDPLDRWKSGVIQFSHDFKRGLAELNNFRNHEKIVYDAHTVKQSDFIKGWLDYNKTEFYWYNDVEKFTTKYNILPKNPHYNETTEKDSNNEYLNSRILDEYLDANPSFEEKIIDFYDDDYKLISKYLYDN